jgi:hypothetical protein
MHFKNIKERAGRISGWPSSLAVVSSTLSNWLFRRCCISRFLLKYVNMFVNWYEPLDTRQRVFYKVHETVPCGIFGPSENFPAISTMLYEFYRVAKSVKEEISTWLATAAMIGRVGCSKMGGRLRL